MPRIVIIDDHALFWAGLVAILKREPRFDIVGEYNGFPPVRPYVRNLDAHVILLDISLGKESGLEIAKYIKHVNMSLKVIVLSVHKEEFYVVNALEAGVDGYFHKDAEPEELITGILNVLSGDRLYSLDISHLLINAICSKPHRGVRFLTNKEKHIVRYLLEGQSSKEIAEIFGVSPRTVETHRANVLGKFGLKNTTELIKKIVEQKIKF